MNQVGVIAIGRNEGERLRACLRSALEPGRAVVYVDSGSTDGSIELARLLGATVISLDTSLPFSAARARNAGIDELLRIAPEISFAQFVDGDCELVEGWIELAATTLSTRSDIAVVCGRRRERFPSVSIYNRLADLEWDRPAGITLSCGGDSMMRVEAFLAAGGFDPTVAAGEEPVLCKRLREMGWIIVRLDAEMTLHDSAMTRFSQWWRRQVRSGYGAYDVASRFGKGREGLFVAQVESARFWTIFWLMALLFALTSTYWFYSHLAVVFVVSAYPLQIARLAFRERRRLGFRDAIAFGVLTLVGKWANLIGQIHYRLDRLAGRNTRLIEYKAPTTGIRRA